MPSNDYMTDLDQLHITWIPLWLVGRGADDATRFFLGRENCRATLAELECLSDFTKSLFSYVVSGQSVIPEDQLVRTGLHFGLWTERSFRAIESEVPSFRAE